MSHDVEHLIKGAGPHEIPNLDLGAVARRARRWKAKRVAAVGMLVSLLVGGGGALVLAEVTPLESKSASNTSDGFRRYFIDAAGADMFVSGVVEVDMRDDTLCLDAVISDNVTAVHLIDRRVDDNAVITFFEPADVAGESRQPPQQEVCVEEDDRPDAPPLADIAEHPQWFAVDLHRGPNDDPGLVAELRAGPGPQWTHLGQPAIETQGYTFSDLELKFTPAGNDQHPSRVELKGRIGWTDGFPGRRNCTFEFYDSKDNLVGSARSTFMAAEPTSGLIRDGDDVSGVPHRVDIDCSSERLDNPDGFFRFGAVSIQPDATSSDKDRFIARASYTWRGEGEPSPQKCTLSLFDPQGRRLFDVRSGLISADGAPHFIVFRFAPPRGTAEEMSDGQIECHPIR